MNGEIELKSYFLNRKVDMVEVVRCKDCQFHDNPEERASVTYWMPCDEYKTDGNWFCGWGKRKDGDGE